jgi:hypothetical protein
MRRVTTMTASPPRRVLVFFYGLFMDSEVLHRQGFQPLNARKATLDGYRLVIGARATLVPDDHGVVHGIATELTHDELQRLYAAPGLEAYRPDAVLLHVGGAALPALCYNLTSPPAGGSNSDYAEKLRALCSELGMPASYIATIG